MRFRHKSASLMVTVFEIDQIEIWMLESGRPGNGHGGALLRSVVTIFSGKWISLTVGSYGPKWMADDKLREFYGRFGFVPDTRPEYPTHMWICP